MMCTMLEKLDVDLGRDDLLRHKVLEGRDWV